MMRVHARRGLWIVVGALFLAPAAAFAAKLKVLPVGLSLTDNARAHAGRVQLVVESAIKRSPRHEYVDPIQKLDPAGIEARAIAKTRGQDAFNDGKRQFEEEGGGLESLNRSIVAFEESWLPETFPALTKTLALRAAARWAEEPVATKRDLQALLALDPKIEFPKEAVAPEMATAIAQARETVLGENKGTLDISTEPVVARVFVDGVARDTTPATVRGLVGSEREHYVTLVAPGYAVVQQKVIVKAGSTLRVQLTPLDRARAYLTFTDRIQKNFGENEEATHAMPLANASQADEVLVTGVRRQGGRVTVTLHRIAARDGHVLSIEEAEFGENDPQFSQRVDGFVTKALATDRPRGAKETPLGLRSGIGKMVSSVGKISENSVKWSLGISGAVLVVAGVSTGIAALDGERQLRLTPQLDPRLASLRSSVFSKALAADILTGVGLGASIGWAWLQFGKQFAKKSALEAPPVLEQKKDAPPPEPEKKEKRRDEDDPFALTEPPPSPWETFVAPIAGGGYFGVQGEF